MQRLPRNSSLIGRLVATLVMLVILGVSLVVGAAIFLALIGIAAVGLALFYVRLRWRSRAGGPKAGRPAPGGGQIIEGEYVIEQERVKQP